MAYDPISQTGVILVDTSELRDEVAQEWKDRFGQDLDTSPETPQGIQITAEALQRAGVLSANAKIANQINPNIAGGVFLDAIAALTGLERTSATRTTVNATITGVSGAIIPAGSRASTGDDEFELVSSVTIPPSGEIIGSFQSVEFGAIPCPAGALNTIVDGVLGWETVENAEAGVLGKDREGDSPFRKKRLRTIALQGLRTPEAIKSRLGALRDVKSFSFLENISSEEETIEGIPMKPHSIWLCVHGGKDEDVARAIFQSRSVGSGMNGNIVVDVVDDVSGQMYFVRFDRAIEIPVAVRVTIKVASSQLTGDPESQIKKAILDYANGETEEDGFVVGADVSIFEIAGAIAQIGGVFVSQIETKKVSDANFQPANISIAINEVATITPSTIMVTIS